MRKVQNRKVCRLPLLFLSSCVLLEVDSDREKHSCKVRGDHFTRKKPGYPLILKG